MIDTSTLHTNLFPYTGTGMKSYPFEEDSPSIHSEMRKIPRKTTPRYVSEENLSIIPYDLRRLPSLRRVLPWDSYGDACQVWDEDDSPMRVLGWVGLEAKLGLDTKLRKN